MKALSPYHVATLRILSAGVVLVPFSVKAFKKVPVNKLGLTVLSGLLGSFFPAYLFCLAETKLNSALAGILNALTPLFTILVGFLFFKMQTSIKKMVGIVIGFTGLVLLFISNGRIDLNNFSYTFLILIATLLYGINVNMVGRFLKDIGSFNIVTVAFSLLIVPCMVILWFTGYFRLSLLHNDTLFSTAASALLGIMGTAAASVLFYMLLKRAGALFASTVTYGIPFIAVFWGVIYGEQITVNQLLSLLVILLGVYLANSNKNPLSVLTKRGINKD